MKATAPSKQTIFSAALLIAGTCTGAGMLAMPVSTGLNGLLPSLAMMALCWMAMTITALLLLEVCLWMEEGAHIITMTSRILGKPGKLISWFLYLFICYASIIAYTDGGGQQIQETFQQLTGMPLVKEWGVALFLTFFIAVYVGAAFVGRLNAILFTAMIMAFCALIAMGIDEIKPHHFSHIQWGGLLLTIPIFLTSFSFQTLVPSLVPYLKRNISSLRWAVIGGTTFTFAVYAIWEAVILGIIPIEGQHGLAEILTKGEVPTLFLQEHVHGFWIVGIAKFFAFFALATSFLGFSLGLYDFLADGLHIKKKGMGSIILGLLILAPTYVCTVYFQRAFIMALDTSGGYGDAILNGLIPVFMVWIGRYKLGYTSESPTPGGKPLLILTGTFYLIAVLVETYKIIGF